MIKTDVFEFKDYKLYLQQVLELRAEREKGQKHKLAIFMGCHAGYLSKVLNEKNDLSLEQAQATNKFLGHTHSEAKFFLNLVLWARAGTADLKAHFNDELEKQIQGRLQLKNRISVGRTLNEETQAKYYSSWHYAAVHICVSLEFLKAKEQIAEALQLPPIKVNEALEFLVEIGVLKKNGGQYSQDETNLFLDKDSAFISKHHTNWRIQSLRSLDDIKPLDLHYSGVVTCTKRDIERIREILLSSIQNVRSTVKEADCSDSFYCNTIDLFNLIKN